MTVPMTAETAVTVNTNKEDKVDETSEQQTNDVAASDESTSTSTSASFSLLHEVTTSDEYFDEINDNDTAIILFEAAWCEASKSIQETMNNLSVKYSSRGNKDRSSDNTNRKTKFLRVDVDQLTNLASEEKVRGLPTVLIYKNKARFSEVCGANQTMIKSVIDKIFL